MIHRDPGSNHIRHAFVFVGILLLHLAAIGALWAGLADPGVSNVETLFQIDVVPADRPQEPPPPLPPATLSESRVIQVAAPEFNVSVAEDHQAPPIQVTARPEDVTAPPNPPAPPARPESLAVPNVKPRPIYVPGGRARYPADSIRAGESGVPTITICISETGAVQSVQVTQSSGFPRLDQAALGIGKEARFRPASLDGKPMSFCVPYRITFAIGNS